MVAPISTMQLVSTSVLASTTIAAVSTGRSRKKSSVPSLRCSESMRLVRSPIPTRSPIEIRSVQCTTTSRLRIDHCPTVTSPLDLIWLKSRTWTSPANRMAPSWSWTRQ
jgi:hypothetical protein